MDNKEVKLKHKLKHIRIKGGKLPDEQRQLVYGASQQSLWKPEGLPAREFLFSKRGLDVETVAGFRIGYVPGENRHQFSERIVMPIFDAYDDLLALSVRPLTNEPDVLKEYLKYWNESYSKGEHLYGLNRAKFDIIKSGFAILVEGQMDVVAMHSYGLTNTIGVLGGAFTTIQAMLLRRWTNQIVIMFDGDAPGQEHTRRCMDVLTAYGYRINQSGNKGSYYFKATSVSLKATGDSKDPNDCLKQEGSRKMRMRVHHAMTSANMTIPSDWID